MCGWRLEPTDKHHCSCSTEVICLQYIPELLESGGNLSSLLKNHK